MTIYSYQFTPGPRENTIQPNKTPPATESIEFYERTKSSSLESLPEFFEFKVQDMPSPIHSVRTPFLSSEEGLKEEEDRIENLAIGSVKNCSKRIYKVWTIKEDLGLLQGIQKFGTDFEKISTAYVETRTGSACRTRFTNYWEVKINVKNIMDQEGEINFKCVESNIHYFCGTKLLIVVPITRTPRLWSVEDDQKLLEGLRAYGHLNTKWLDISRHYFQGERLPATIKMRYSDHWKSKVSLETLLSTTQTLVVYSNEENPVEHLLKWEASIYPIIFKRLNSEKEVQQRNPRKRKKTKEVNQKVENKLHDPLENLSYKLAFFCNSIPSHQLQVQSTQPTGAISHLLDFAPSSSIPLSPSETGFETFQEINIQNEFNINGSKESFWETLEAFSKEIQQLDWLPLIE